MVCKSHLNKAAIKKQSKASFYHFARVTKFEEK